MTPAKYRLKKLYCTAFQDNDGSWIVTLLYDGGKRKEIISLPNEVFNTLYEKVVGDPEDVIRTKRKRTK